MKHDPAKLEKKKLYYSKNKHQWQRYQILNRDKLRQKARLRYASNRESILAKSKINGRKPEVIEANRIRAKAWRVKNRDANLAEKKRWWAEHRDEQRANKRAHYQNNKEALKAKTKAYFKLHPEVAANTQAKRRALKAGSQVDPKGIKAWMKEVRTKPFARCHWCGTKVKGRNIHFDHVTPLSKGGSHTIGNLAASCMECNSSKHDRLLTEWVRCGQVFLNL